MYGYIKAGNYFFNCFFHGTGRDDPAVKEIDLPIHGQVCYIYPITGLALPARLLCGQDR
jgi:hypothetical protein